MAFDRQSAAEVQERVFRLFYALDNRDYLGVASSFHEDGVWVRLGKQLVGRAQMLEALEQRSPTMVIHHVITNLFFDGTADSHCKVVCYLTAYRHDNGTAIPAPAPLKGPSQLGICRAEARKDAAGVWRLSYLNADGPTFLAS